MTAALVRYVAADALRSGRWAGPLLLYLAGTTAFDIGGGTALSCYSFTASLLLPVGLWLSVVIGNCEEPSRAAITIVTVGSPLRVLLAKLLTCYLLSLPLVVFGLVWAPLIGRPISPVAALAGLVAHLLCTLIGVAGGAMLTRPVLDRAAWVVCLAVGGCLAEIAVPHSAPVRQLLALLANEPLTGRHAITPLAVIAAETGALAAVLISAGYAIGLRRR